MTGPLHGVKVIELAGIGPGPYACMLLADLGADVLRISRGGVNVNTRTEADILCRSRHEVALNLKSEAGRDLVLELCADADVFVEGYRPGVTERMGLGPNDVWRHNPAVIYGRMTGYGQEGPLAMRAGHDINYISISGALWPVGRAGERPVPPLNLVGDFAGGSMFLVMGILAALLAARSTGEGQIVDAAMVDGSASLMAMTHSFMNGGFWTEERGVNMLDTGAHFYEVYETKDKRFMAVGAIEPQFYQLLLDGLGLTSEDLPHQMDRSQWPTLKEKFAAIFATKTRDEWTDIFAEVDACVTPVLSPSEAARHPYNTERNVFSLDGETQPQPAPRFSKTVASIRELNVEDDDEVNSGLFEWGVDKERQQQLRAAGAFG